jgi:hypothetical protein
MHSTVIEHLSLLLREQASRANLPSACSLWPYARSPSHAGRYGSYLVWKI